MIILPKFRPGDRVDYVYRGLRGGSGPGGQFGSMQGGISQTIKKAGDAEARNAFERAIEEKEGTRKRATIDAMVSEIEYRLIIEDSNELVWAHPHEIEALDPVSKLGDLVGVNSKTLQSGLDDIEDEVHICVDCNQPIEGVVNWLGKETRCDPCRNKALGRT
jgi:hypothetical protein